jgi:putative transposase
MKQHNLEHSTSRRGNCHDNAFSESFFNPLKLKRKRIRRKTYKTQDNARQYMFVYIEMFYSPQRRNAGNVMLSPIHFGVQQNLNPKGV